MYNACFATALSAKAGNRTCARKQGRVSDAFLPRALLRHYDLSESIGEALLRMPGQQGRLRVLRHVVELGLDTKGTETLVDGELARMPLPMTSGRHMKPLMRDYRLYLNAIREIVEQMQDAGLRADMRVNTGRAAVDVRISIPVFTGRK